MWGVKQQPATPKVKEGNSRQKPSSIKAQKSKQVCHIQAAERKPRGKYIKKSKSRPDHAGIYMTGYGVPILQLGKQSTKSRKEHRDLYVVLQDSETRL